MSPVLLALACYTPSPLPAPEDTARSPEDDSEDPTVTDLPTVTWTPELVTVNFTATVATVVGAPFGIDATWYESPVEGSFTYDRGVPDSRTDSEEDGEYNHRGSAAFVLDGLPVTLSGSGWATIEVKDEAADVWRFIDGGRTDDDEPRFMLVDGVEDETVELWFSTGTDDDTVLSSDAQPAVLPFDGTDPTTFSFDDGEDDLLLHLTSLTPADDAS